MSDDAIELLDALGIPRVQEPMRKKIADEIERLQGDYSHLEECNRMNMAEIERLCEQLAGARKALEFIRDGYERADINHVDFRVGAYKAALDALTDETSK